MGQDIINPKPLGYQEFVIAVRKAAEIYQERFFIVVGRGSLSASMPDSSPMLRTTGDVDLFAPFKAERLDAWSAADALVSVESDFFLEHGFYIERVGEWTLLSQPVGWQERCISIRIEDIDLLVIHPLDLAYNKLEAGRDKDIEFMAEGLRSGAYAADEMRKFIEDGAPDQQTKRMMHEVFERALTLSKTSTEH